MGNPNRPRSAAMGRESRRQQQRLVVAGGLLFLLVAALAPTTRAGRASGALARTHAGGFWCRGKSSKAAVSWSSLWGVRGGADKKAPQDDAEDGEGESNPAAGAATAAGGGG